MSLTGLEVFDATVHKTNVWLREIMEQLATEDRHKAYTALRATLQALRDRLTPDAAAELGAQLPMLVRGLFYEGWSPKMTPVKARHREDFLLMIKARIPNHELDVEQAARAVLTVLRRHVGAEAEKIRHNLPSELKELWAPMASDG
jgi:uncharacterized protein (DUF2267 family)